MSSSSSSIAARKVGSNQDLLIQIISRLPIKSVLRFKSISKTVLSLVKELDSHLRRRRTSCDPVHGIFLRMVLNESQRSNDRTGKAGEMHQYISMNPIKNRSLTNESTQEFPKWPAIDKRIVQSSNGLFLYTRLRRFYVYNATTLSDTLIPNHPGIDNDLSATLVFDPVISLHYKLIFATRHDDLYIYSSETGTWSGGFTCKIPTFPGLKNGVYWNGSVHWMATPLDDGANYPWYTKPESSIRFHVDTQTTHEIPEPLKRRAHTFECNFYFGETGGHLHYIDSGVDNSIQIQEMKTDYSEWFVKYRVNLSKVMKGLSKRDYPVNGGYPRNSGKFRDFDFLSVIRSGEEKSVLLLWVNKKVISCNLVNLKFKTLAEISDGYEPLGSGFPFIPSLSDT